MKIIYYAPCPTLSLRSPAGYATHMREMIGAMRQLGHEVLPVIMGDVIASGKDNVDIVNFDFSFKSLIKYFLPGFIWRSLKEYRLLKFDDRAESYLIEKIIDFQPDLIYERGNGLQQSGINASSQKNILHYMELNAPFIEELYDFENAMTLWSRKARKIEKMQVEQPERVFVVSSALKLYYSKLTNDPDKIIVTPNCVDPLKLTVDNVLREKLIEKYQLHDKQIIGFVGSIFPYHGVDILIHAFARVALSHPDSILLIVGDGAILPDLKMLSGQLGVEKRTIFTGSVSHAEVFTYIDIMDITVLAKTNWYCSPMKIFEYGAMKKAIIAPDTISVKDVMEHNVDGILINSNESELCAAIDKLFKDESFKRKVSENFHNKVLNNYVWLKLAENILK